MQCRIHFGGRFYILRAKSVDTKVLIIPTSPLTINNLKRTQLKIACFNIQQCIIAYNPHAGKNILSPVKVQYRNDQWKQGSVSILILPPVCIEDLPFCIRDCFKQISDLVISCAMLLGIKLASFFFIFLY